MTLGANWFLCLFVTGPARRCVALPLSGTDLENVHAAAARGLRRAMALVARGCLEMRRAMPEIELLERLFRPAYKTDRQRSIDMTDPAIA